MRVQDCVGGTQELGECEGRERGWERTLTVLGLTRYYLIVILPGRLARGDMMLGRERKESDREEEGCGMGCEQKGTTEPHGNPVTSGVEERKGEVEKRR